MPRLLGILVAFVVIGLIVSAVLAAIYLVMIVSLVGVGLIGFLFVKLKRPLVNPNGPAIVPLVYSIIWAAMISSAFLLGSVVINSSTGMGKFAYVAWVRDAIIFFVQTALTLFISTRFSLGLLASTNIARARALACTTAAVIFAVKPDFLDLEKADILLRLVVHQIIDLITFPITLLLAIIDNYSGAVNRARQWVIATNGNLFELSAVMSKLLWIVAIFNFIKSLGRKMDIQPAPMWNPTLSAQERTIFGVTVLLGVTILIIAQLDAMELRHELRGGDVLVWSNIAVYAGLWVALWRSRARQ